MSLNSDDISNILHISKDANHEHNAIAVAEQEYEMAKEHVREVCLLRDPMNPDHQKRFRDAMDRQEAARERYLELLDGPE